MTRIHTRSPFPTPVSVGSTKGDDPRAATSGDRPGDVVPVSAKSDPARDIGQLSLFEGLAAGTATAVERELEAIDVEDRSGDHPSAGLSAIGFLSAAALRKLGERGYTGYPGAREIGPQTTLIDIWNDYCARSDIVVDKPSFFAPYKRGREALKVLDRPHPDWILRAFLAVFGKKGVHRTRVIAVLGEQAAVDAMRRLNLMIGVEKKAPVTRGRADLEDLLAMIPEAVRDLFREHLAQPRFPAIKAPHPTLMSRACRIEQAPLRLMCTLSLISAAERQRSKSLDSNTMKHVEVHSARLQGVNLQNEDAIASVLMPYLAGETGGGSDLVRTVAIAAWFRMQREARRLASVVLGARAEMLTDLLPACPEPTGAFATLFFEKKAKTETPASAEGTVSRVADLVPRLITIQAACENRIHQLEKFLAKCREALPAARAILEAGGSAGFECRMRVIRADGSLGEGEQITSFTFRLESALYERALARTPDERYLQHRFPRHWNGETKFIAFAHQPKEWSRIHIVYGGTEPVDPGDECVEPFFLDLFRWGVFEPDGRASDLLRERRLGLIDELQLPQYIAPVEGLLGHPKSRRTVIRWARGMDPADGEIVIPLIDFYHAMAYARIAIRFGIRWGARLGETLQLSIGCNRTHLLAGVSKPYVALKPKGWTELGKFGMDAGTAKAIAEVRKLTNVRWHGGRLTEAGTPWLPVVPSSQAHRDDLPDAQYIFQATNRMLDKADVMRFVQVLLFRIVNLKSHDQRRVFATALGLKGHTYERIGSLLHHSPKSAMPAKYDLSGLVLAEEAAEQFNATLTAYDPTLD